MGYPVFLGWRHNAIRDWRNSQVQLATWEALPFWKRMCVARPVTREVCACISSVEEPSLASLVHDVRFHVCDRHAKEFGIVDGPYWFDTIALATGNNVIPT